LAVTTPSTGNCLGHAAQNAEVLEGFIEPGTEPADLLLHAFQLAHVAFHAGPLRSQAGQLPLLDRNGASDSKSAAAAVAADQANLREDNRSQTAAER
jgi:hypothetical protein